VCPRFIKASRHDPPFGEGGREGGAANEVEELKRTENRGKGGDKVRENTAHVGFPIECV